MLPYLLAAVLLAQPLTLPPNGEITARCVGVETGDILRIQYGGGVHRLKLWATYCPPRSSRFGNVAFHLSKRQVADRTLHIAVKGHDPYARVDLLGEVFYGKQRASLNEALVNAGLAWADYRFDPLFRPNEERARTRRIGMWKNGNPRPPWDHKPKGAGGSTGRV